MQVDMPCMKKGGGGQAHTEDRATQQVSASTHTYIMDNIHQWKKQQLTKWEEQKALQMHEYCPELCTFPSDPMHCCGRVLT